MCLSLVSSGKRRCRGIARCCMIDYAQPTEEGKCKKAMSLRLASWWSC
jgi:hypothetical protein